MSGVTGFRLRSVILSFNTFFEYQDRFYELEMQMLVCYSRVRERIKTGENRKILIFKKGIERGERPWKKKNI